MRAWLTLLFPMLVWGFHFTSLYLAVEFLPEWSGHAAVPLTLLGVAALAGFWVLQRQAGGMMRTAVRLGTLLSLTAIAAQSLPFIASA